MVAWYLSPAITQRSMRFKEVLRISRSKRNWLRHDERSRSERTNGERIRSGCTRGAPILRCERRTRDRQVSCTLRTGGAWAGATISCQSRCCLKVCCLRGCTSQNSGTLSRVGPLLQTTAIALLKKALDARALLRIGIASGKRHGPGCSCRKRIDGRARHDLRERWTPG